jgi:hypothetical protein
MEAWSDAAAAGGIDTGRPPTIGIFTPGGGPLTPTGILGGCREMDAERATTAAGTGVGIDGGCGIPGFVEP